MHTIQVLKSRDEITIARIRADLELNPPGTGILDSDVEFAVNAPYYLEYLLTRLEEAERPLWQKVLRKSRRILKILADECLIMIKIPAGFLTDIIWALLCAFTGGEFPRLRQFSTYHLNPYPPTHPELVRNHSCLIHNRKGEIQHG